MNAVTLQGYRTYIAAAGLIALAFYQLTQADVPNAIQNLLAALAAFGLHEAIKAPAVPAGR